MRLLIFFLVSKTLYLIYSIKAIQYAAEQMSECCIRCWAIIAHISSNFRFTRITMLAYSAVSSWPERMAHAYGQTDGLGHLLYHGFI